VQSGGFAWYVGASPKIGKLSQPGDFDPETQMAHLRLFIAIDPPDATRRALTRTLREIKPELQGIRWVRPETLHLTLKFLGDTPEESIPELTAAARQAFRAIRPAKLSFCGLGVFPNRRRPSVLWAGIEGGKDWLTNTVASLERALADIGIPPEARSFRPHLTLGRIGRGTHLPAAELSRVLETYASRSFGEGPITEATLFASTLTPQGAIHEQVAEFPFHG
jgi:2'-5' RNA ligase